MSASRCVVSSSDDLFFGMKSLRLDVSYCIVEI